MCWLRVGCLSMSNTNLQLITTKDGSYTFFHPIIGEHYHSIHGAAQESKHVFIYNGLKYKHLQSDNHSPIKILEIGLGTGLNFLLSAQYALEHKINIEFVGIEPYLLPTQAFIDTQYHQWVGNKLHTSFINKYELSTIDWEEINPYTRLKICNDSLENVQLDVKFDLVYYDAFSVIHQPAMWTLEQLEKCSSFLKKGGVFVTYAITGNLKRNLRTLGFEIEKLKGPPGKREMLRGIKN